jgi:hypothetical protein
MKKNDHVEFVGLEKLLAKQLEQLIEFERWASANDWQSFHAAHYDWWMFPIDHSSRLGFSYTVYEAEVIGLKTQEHFIKNYLRGVELLLLSWGWELKNSRFIENPEEEQTWHQRPIRIYKCLQSLIFFGFEKEAQSVKLYAKSLIARGEDFSFRGKELKQLFLEE